MTKLIGVIAAAMLLLPAANPDRGRFAKYKAVEAYEIRPGVLMMPRYSADGQVCEIGLEKLHYTHELVHLDSDVSRKEIDEIFDELVPDSERGPKPENPLAQVLGGGISGRAMIDAEQYQNVAIYIYGELSRDLSSEGKDPPTLDEVVAVATWKNRTCSP